MNDKEQRDALDKIKVLERRLEVDYARIEEARQTGGDVERWEAFWIDLMRTYEEALKDDPR